MEPCTPGDEAYRGLLAVLEAALAGDAPAAPRACLVAGVDRPTTEVGVRLASAYAATGRPSLLIATDPHSPADHHLLGTGPAPLGLAEWLRNDAPDPALPIYPTAVPNLSLLPAGRPLGPNQDPLGGTRLADLFAGARQVAARIVVVARPLAAAADALLLGRHVDGVLLVVVPGKTTGSDARRSRDALRQAGARILGVALEGQR